MSDEQYEEEDGLICCKCGDLVERDEAYYYDDGIYCEGCNAWLSADDEWILENKKHLQKELLEIATSGKPKPCPHTLLGRALFLFTMEGEE